MKKTIILLFAVLFNTIFVVKAQQMNGAGYTDGEKTAIQLQMLKLCLKTQM